MGVRDFVDQYGGLAAEVGARIGVAPNILLGQWGVETGWGKSVIPGTNNLGNIKSFNGSGVSATDNMTGSNDNYRQYGDASEFGSDFASLLERSYKGAIGAGSDAEAYAKALKAGGYAEDSAYVEKLKTASEMAKAAGATDATTAPQLQKSAGPWGKINPNDWFAKDVSTQSVQTGIDNDFGRATKKTAWGEINPSEWITGNKVEPAKPQPEETFMGAAARGIKKTIPELKQAGAGAVAYLGDVFGAEGVKEWGLNKYHEIEDGTKNLQSENDSFSKVVLDGEGSFKSWLGNAVGYSVGQVGLALVSGGIGAIGGKMIAKQGLTKLVEGEIAKSFEKNVAAGMAEEAAKAAAIKTGQEVAAGALIAGRNTGAFTAAFLQNETQELGSIYNDAVEQAKKEGRTLDGGDLFRIGASSLAAAGVDTAMEAVNFSKITKGGVGSTLAKRAAVEIPSGMASEGVTEAIQTGIEQYGAGKPLDTREIIDSAALGAVGGGMGGAGASLHQRTAKDAETLSDAATLPVTPVVTPEEIAAIPQAPAELSPREQRQQAVADKLYPLPAQRETASTAERQLEAINAINPLPEQRDGTIGVRQTPFTDAEIAAGVEPQKNESQQSPQAAAIALGARTLKKGDTVELDDGGSFTIDGAGPMKRSNPDGPWIYNVIWDNGKNAAFDDAEMSQQLGPQPYRSADFEQKYSAPAVVKRSEAEKSGKVFDAVPPPADAGQPAGQINSTENAANTPVFDPPIIGSDAKNGFQHGPDGTKYRIGVSDAVGGAIALEMRYPAGTIGTFYVTTAGTLIDADGINLISDQGKLWVPKNEEQSTKVQELLRERAQLALTDPKRKTLLAAIREIVTNTQPNNAPILSANGQPFATLKAAETSIKARGLSGAVAVSVKGGGFGIRMAAPASAQNTAPAQAIPQNSTASVSPAPAQDTSLKATATLAQAIRKFGGLPEKFARDLTGEPALTANKLPGYRGLFHANGTDLSTLVHDGKLDAYLPPNLRSDVRDDSRPTDTDAAVAHIEAILRNGEAQTAKSYARTEAKQQRLTAAAQKQQVVAPVEKGDTQAAADAISEAEYEHFKQTGEPGFGWMPGAETFADSLDANTIEQLDALLNLPESTDERAAMRSMGFTEDEITETLGPDAAASTGTNQVPESAPAASESTPASREAAPPAAEVNPNEAAAKALESAAAALREVGKPSAKPADNDFLSELFGRPSSQPAEPQQQQKSGQRGIAAIRAAIRSAIDSAIRERDDWSSRNYKANKKQVELRGDGPGNNAAMSVGSINESRRNKAIESLNQEIAALGKLEKQVSSDSGATQVMAGMSEIMETAKRSYESGNYPGSTVNDLFESILLDRLKFRGPGGKGSVTSNGLSKAALSAITEQTRPTLDLTNPTESKLRTDDAKQKRDAAEKAAKENAPSPEEFGLVGSNRAADVGAAAGQNSLFQNTASYGNNAANENEAYATDLFGDPVPSATRAPRADSAKRPALRRDAQPKPALRDTERPDGEYLASTIVGTSGERELGVSRILTAEHAAAATRYLYRSAVERFDAIVTDKNGKPLAVVGGFKGAPTQTAVYPSVVIAEAMRVPGAANIWLSHNHPSGSETLSNADIRLESTFSDALRGSGIQHMGLLAVAGDLRYSHVYDGNITKGESRGPGSATISVPVIERELADNRIDKVSVNAPDIAKQVARDFYEKSNGPGVILLDAQHKLLGWMTITPNMYGALRGKSGGLNAIYRALSHSGAVSGIIAHGGELDARIGDIERVTASQNIAAALSKVDVSPLDSINVKTGKSVAMIGDRVAEGPLFSRSDTIEVDGKQRPRSNSNGKPIAATDEGIRNFWRWFAGSRVVDDQGRPLVVYHGTTSDINSFDSTKLGANTDAGSARLAFFFTSDQRTAESYGNFAAADARVQAILKEADRAEKRGNWDLYDQKIQEAEALDASFADPQNRQAGQNVLPVYLRIENPSELDAGGEDYTSLEGGLTAQIRGAKRGGQDGVIIKNLDDAVGLTNVVADHYAVFKPNQIKSATGNTGQFSPDNADIRFSREAPLWRSTLTEAIGKTSFAQAPADQWKAWLNANAAKLGVKKDEIEWSGVTDWLDLQKGKVTRDQVREFLDANGVKVTETMLADGEYEPTFVEQDDDGMWRVYGERANEGDVYDTAEQANAKSEEYNADIPAGPSKYSSYQLPGGTNYRELLLTLPDNYQSRQQYEKAVADYRAMLKGKYGDIQLLRQDSPITAAERAEYERLSAAVDSHLSDNTNFKSSHWDQPNILAHIRFNERTDADGKKVLFIEEIQSDWGQAGKKQGFAGDVEKQLPAALQETRKAERNTGDVFDRLIATGLSEQEANNHPDFVEAYEQERASKKAYGELANRAKSNIPNAPMIGKTEAWVSLSLKRMIRYAVDNGFDRIAMVNGEQSAERYDLSKSISRVEYTDKGVLIATDTNGREALRQEVAEDKIEDYIGKEPARKLLSAQWVRDPGRGDINAKTKRIEGDGLKVGGEGMKAFYDRIVPQVANDVLKKLGGGKVGTVVFEATGKGRFSVFDDDSGDLLWQGETRKAANDFVASYSGDASVKEGSADYDKFGGTQPGFDITDKMREQAAQGMPLFRRDEQQPATTNTHAADVIAKAAKTVNIPLDVYATPREASAKLGIYIPSDVRGLLYRGRAALISSNITTRAMGEFVLWHELFHAGITLVAPRYSNEYNRIMQDMAARNSNIIKAARDWRNSYGEETIKRSMEAGLSQEQAEKRMRLMAIEEAIADLAGANIELKGWTQFVAKLQALLRSMGFDNLANWIEGKSNAEVLQLIARTRDEVTTQNLHLTTQVPAFARDEDDASYQRAYHGTPHKFDKFSLDKIGTGEGAQAYGYGLYFASKREIAEHYRNALGRPDSAGLSRAQDLAAWAYSMQSPYAGDAMEHLNDEIARMEKHGKFNDKVIRSDYEEAKRIVASGEVISNGRLYQVDIPEDSEMLHWDKPLSEQPEAVKVALEKSNPALFQKNWYDAETKQPTELGETSGKMLNGVLSEVMDGSEYYRSLSSQTGGGAQASAKLRSLGIRGIKYLDGVSRNAGDGSYNYVVFDDNDVSIEAVHSRGTNDGMANDKTVVGNTTGRPADDVISGATAASQMLDAIERDPYADYAIRVIPGEFTGSVNVGDTLPVSNKWEDGTDTGKPLRGTSGIGIEQRSLKGVEQAIHRIGSSKTAGPNGFYFGNRVVLIKGESVASGEDVGESVIQNAEVVGVWTKPTKGKSEVQPNEQTTSQDGDVAFSRTGSGDIFDKNATAAQSTYNGTEAVQGMGMSVKNVMRQTANIARDKRGAALSFLGGRQIADIYSKDVPELPKYNEILQRMQAEQNEGSAVADSIIEKWRVINRKRPDVATQLSSLMHDSTLAQVDPDVSADNAELRKRWINLPQEAKDIYREARDAYVAHFEKVKAELIDRVERSALDTSAKNRTLASMREEFTKAMKGVYFPLARFGDYMVVVKDKAGVTQSVSMAETTNQAQALRAELLRAYPDYIVGAIQKKKEFNAERDGVSRGFMKDLVALISEEPDAQTRDSQLDAINQLWLSSLPDLSWAKSGIHRKGTPGYSNDAMRAFARNMFHGGYHLAKLRYGDRLGDTLAQMQETIDNKVRSNPEYSNVVAQSVVDEMNARHKHVMNPQNTPVANALTGLGFMWHIGLSPASAVVNLSQTALVAYPMLASKFGFGKAATMLLSLSADAVKGKNDLLSQLQGAEKDAYDRAVREGLIDVTMAHDLAGVSQGKSGEFNEKQQRVMRVASVMFHEAEKFNRGVTFMSAYRLAVQSGVSDPYKLAHDLTFDSHFDYSSQNRPRVMQGPTARVILLFKQYGQNMIYTLSRNTFKALQGDREAQKTLAGLLAMHGMFAGALGLPLMTTLLAAASAIGGSDDEPWDAQVALRNYLADVFGKDIGEVLAHGVFRAPGIKDAIGADISGRVGLDSMLIRMPQETLEGKKYYQALLETIAGPVFGIGGNIANGMQTMAQGNTLRGIEEMLPKSIKDPLKAYRYEQDGIQDKTGITIVDETTIPEEVAQFLGFSPARGMEGFEGKSAIKNQETLLTQRRRQLMQRYGKDAEEGDTADSLTAIQRWNIANPTMAIKGQDLLRSMREKAKRQAEAENGAYLSKKRRGLAELGEFANAE